MIITKEKISELLEGLDKGQEAGFTEVKISLELAMQLCKEALKADR